jgi:hypothetical protein
MSDKVMNELVTDKEKPMGELIITKGRATIWLTIIAYSLLVVSGKVQTTHVDSTLLTLAALAVAGESVVPIIVNRLFGSGPGESKKLN